MKWLFENEYSDSLIQFSLPKATGDRAKEIEGQVRGITHYELKRLCVGLRIRDRELGNSLPKRIYTERRDQNHPDNQSDSPGITGYGYTIHAGTSVDHQTFPDQVYRKVKEAGRIAFPGRRIRLHDLRHGGIMHYRSKGWPDSLVSQLARHASSEVTSKIYGGIDPAELKRTLNHYDI